MLFRSNPAGSREVCRTDGDYADLLVYRADHLYYDRGPDHSGNENDFLGLPPYLGSEFCDIPDLLP